MRRLTWLPPLGAGLAAGLPAAVQAAEPAVPASFGAWLFATVALLLVGALAWLLGLATGRRRGLAEARLQDNRGDRAGDPAGRGAAAESLAPLASVVSEQRSDDAAAFSYALSHDLRAPLRVVEGFARILKEDYGRQLDRIGNDHLDRLLGASTRMHAMIDGMLALAQLSATPLARQTVSLSDMAAQVVDELRAAQPERVVAVSIEPGLVVRGDPTLLRQMLDNLLGNAWKYSARVPSAHIGLRASQRDGRRLFEVYDNGAGFDMRAAGRLFGLFQRLHGQSDFPGTGLGLASVQRIVRRHGGQVWAEAEPGRGARFFFSLPD